MNDANLKTIAIVADLLLLFIAWLLVKKTDIIKDISCMLDREKPYSYARTQLLWWTVIVMGCFIYAAIVSNLVPDLNETALFLLGISAATTASGAVIDGTDMKAEQDKPKPDVTANAANLTQSANTTDAVPERHQDTKSRNFFTDILSDAQGVSIHRFQGVLFNIVYGVTYILIFFHQTFAQQVFSCFPIFNSFVLGLLGISSAGYIVLKTGENKSEVLATINEKKK